MTHFTGKERDAETGLDYFGARYFSGAQGRFGSLDPLLNSGRPEDPQSWNRYGYGLNNPLRFIDPTGLDPISVEDCKKDPACTVVPVNVIYDKNANIYDASGKTLAQASRSSLMPNSRKRPTSMEMLKSLSTYRSRLVLSRS